MFLARFRRRTAWKRPHVFSVRRPPTGGTKTPKQEKMDRGHFFVILGTVTKNKTLPNPHFFQPPPHANISGTRGTPGSKRGSVGPNSPCNQISSAGVSLKTAREFRTFALFGPVWAPDGPKKAECFSRSSTPTHSSRSPSLTPELHTACFYVLVLHATAYSTCSIVLHCIAGYTSVLVY